MEDKELSGATLIALKNFYLLKNIERKVEKAEADLNSSVSRIPEDEMNEYVKRTS